MPAVTSITIVYDAGCGLCTGLKDWIGQQTALVRLDFIAAGSSEARDAYPQLPAGELAVVAGTGEVWLGNGAWIVCLWALRDYRDFAVRLTSPLLMLLAREAFSLVSRNRAAISTMLRLRNERQIERHLRRVVVPKCQTEANASHPGLISSV
jgi:predicted DCC family thiol-disulfide oxidoreductase YuxK